MTNILDSLQWRYATKAFDPSKKISDTDFQKLIDALILTPSSYGLQPWKFVVVENPALRAELRPHSWNQSQITDASHLIVLCRENTIDEAYIENYIQRIMKIRGVSAADLAAYKTMMVNNVVKGKNPQVQAEWAKDQVYIALGNLMTVAASLGIDSCPIEGFDSAKYDEILKLHEKGLSSCVVCPVGYRSVNDNYAQAKKVRFEEKDLVVMV